MGDCSPRYIVRPPDFSFVPTSLLGSACVRVGNDASEWFPVNVGLRQGWVMSPWYFNV